MLWNHWHIKRGLGHVPGKAVGGWEVGRYAEDQHMGCPWHRYCQSLGKGFQLKGEEDVFGSAAFKNYLLLLVLNNISCLSEHLMEMFVSSSHLVKEVTKNELIWWSCSPSENSNGKSTFVFCFCFCFQLCFEDCERQLSIWELLGKRRFACILWYSMDNLAWLFEKQTSDLQITMENSEHLQRGQNAWRKRVQLLVNWIIEKKFRLFYNRREIWVSHIFCSDDCSRPKHCWKEWNVKNEIENSTKNIILSLQGSIIGSLEYLAYLSFYLKKDIT